MILATHGIVGSQITQFVGLLDTYSGAAAAYSLRKLRTAYTGSAIRVRRSVGSPAEKDIGFVNNELDVSDLQSFCSGTDGFVTTWYDQSGNGRDATQTTAANQPQIVSSGSVITQNGKPSIQLDGGSSFMGMQSVGNMINNINYFNSFTLLQSSSNGQICVFESTYSNGNARVISERGRTTTNAYGIGGRRVLSDTFNYNVSNTTTSSFVLMSNIIDYLNSNLYIYQNGSNVASNTSYQADGSTDTDTTNFVFFRRALVSSGFFNGKCSELIMYTSNQSSNRTGIESNINDFYSIY
jgi:hypothetical protein